MKCFSMVLDATIYVGGLDDKVTESLMWELFVQSGPVGTYYIYPLLYFLIFNIRIIKFSL